MLIIACLSSRGALGTLARPHIALEPTAYSFGFAYASGGGSPRAFGGGEEKTMADWEVYESVAAYLLNKMSSEFGLERVEGKQKLMGQRSGTTWEIDAKGFCRGKAGFVIIECRRNITSKQNQEKIGGLAYRIIDTGATGGIIVSPLGLQEGAERVALAENIVGVALNENCTKDIFVLRFRNKIVCGFPDPSSMMQRFGRMKRDCIP